MRTKLIEKNYKKTVSVAMDEETISKIEKIQRNTLLDRSQVVRIVFHQLTNELFGKMMLQERKVEPEKVYFKRTSNKKKKK